MSSAINIFVLKEEEDQSKDEYHEHDSLGILGKSEPLVIVIIIWHVAPYHLILISVHLLLSIMFGKILEKATYMYPHQHLERPKSRRIS